MLVRNPVVIHWVHDMDGALRFYRELFDTTAVSESPGWSVLDLAPIHLALHLVDPGGDERPLRDAGLNLEVDDLDALVARASALGGALRRIVEPQPHLPLRVAVVEDSEGNAFELRQRV